MSQIVKADGLTHFNLLFDDFFDANFLELWDFLVSRVFSFLLWRALFDERCLKGRFVYGLGLNLFGPLR